jgi:hypothetical protein
MSKPTTEDLKNAKKFPWQWAVYTLIAAISFIASQYISRIDKGDETCQQRVTNLQKVAAKKDSIIFYWQGKYINITNELLYKNNIIDRQNQVINNTDSVARRKFEKPAKQILKSNE